MCVVLGLRSGMFWVEERVREPLFFVKVFEQVSQQTSFSRGLLRVLENPVSFHELRIIPYGVH